MKIKQCVHGLTDTSRVLYLIVKEDVMKLGTKESKYDLAVFIFHHDNKLQGIVSTFVGDFFWADSEHFITKVIDCIRKNFKIKSEERGKFKHLGLDLIQNRIVVKQDKFFQALALVTMWK